MQGISWEKSSVSLGFLLKKKYTMYLIRQSLECTLRNFIKVMWLVWGFFKEINFLVSKSVLSPCMSVFFFNNLPRYGGNVSRLASHSPYCVGTGSGWKVKWATCRLCGFVQALQLADNFSKVAPYELLAPVPMPEMERLECKPRMKNRATDAITVVMADQEGTKGKKIRNTKILY